MKAAVAVAALISLSACATQSVTLLPGEPGRPVGALAVLNEDGSEKGVIASADTSTALGGGFHAHQQAPGAIDRLYATLIGDLPPPAEHFTLNFDIGMAAPGTDQEAILRQIFASAAARPGAEVQVVGHTDRLGTEGYNDALSRERAEQVRRYLIGRGLAPTLVRATWRGEREPLVETADGVGNAKNRRVEVIVR
jgi:outer membrane protein OmpA-like peptidoglycan-associated protein